MGPGALTELHFHCKLVTRTQEGAHLSLGRTRVRSCPFVVACVFNHRSRGRSPGPFAAGRAEFRKRGGKMFAVGGRVSPERCV